MFRIVLKCKCFPFNFSEHLRCVNICANVLFSDHQAEVGGAQGTGEVAEQEEEPQEGDQAGPHRDHCLHHLLAPSLGHSDRPHQVSSLHIGKLRGTRQTFGLEAKMNSFVC